MKPGTLHFGRFHRFARPLRKFRARPFETLLCAVLLATLTACERDAAHATSQPAGPVTATTTPSAGEAATPSSQEREALLSLPYAGFAAEAAGGQEGDGVVLFDRARSQPGYTFVTYLWNSGAHLMDEEGRVVRQWKTRPSRCWNHACLTADGGLLVCGAYRFRSGREAVNERENYLARYAPGGERLWQIDLNVHHDVVLTPDGNVMTLAYFDRPIPALISARTLRDDELVTLDPNGNMLERQSLYDILARKPELFPFEPIERVGTEVLHSNSIHWIQRPKLAGQHPIYEPGNILISSRNQDRIFAVNWPRKELVWAWGKGQLEGQHDAEVLENGNILLFDNGLYRKWSRVLELDPRTERIVWEYKAARPADFFSASRGSSQRLANGNTLIANSDNGEAFEVTPADEIVWRFLVPYKNEKGQRATIVRVERHDRAVIEDWLRRHPAAATQPASP